MQQPKQPLLSILIATKNRVPYAISALKSILRIEDARLELVIQDNSDSRDLEHYIKNFVSDTRLRYRYIPPPFSSIDNFNAAIELATGEFVCLIGDDDGINPEIIEAAQWLNIIKYDNLAIQQRVNFLWKNSGVNSTLFTKISGGVLSIRDIEAKLFFPNVKKNVLDLMQNGGVYYLDFWLPKLYHGIVRRSCLEEIKQKTGNYLGGLSPDIYSSLSLACITDKVVITDYPLTVPGACGASTSVTEGTLKNHSKKLENAPHFRDRGKYNWSPEVPRVYAVECIWADSGLTALRAMGRDDLVKKFDLSKHAAYCIAFNKNVAKQVLSDVLKYQFNKNKYLVPWCLISIVFGFITGPLVKFNRRIWNRILLLLGKRHVHNVYNLDDMAQVTDALSDYLMKNKLSLSKLLSN